MLTRVFFHGLSLGMFFNAVYDKAGANTSFKNWQVGSVEDFTDMFKNSKAYNENVCSWVGKMKIGALVSNMFFGTGCPYTTVDLSKRLFCYQC